MGEREVEADFLRTVQLRLRLDQPLVWDGGEAAARDLRDRMEADEELALDAVDLALRQLHTDDPWSERKVAARPSARVSTSSRRGETLAGRDLDPSGAYREAVRAVEAVAKPVILPSSDRATLGTMIAAMRDKPEKWETTLGKVDDVLAMMRILWTNQLDRHGTDDDSIPVSVSLEQADAAFATSLNLVHLSLGATFASRRRRRRSGPRWLAVLGRS
jgi:hypothetical protein